MSANNQLNMQFSTTNTILGLIGEFWTALPRGSLTRIQIVTQDNQTSIHKQENTHSYMKLQHNITKSSCNPNMFLGNKLPFSKAFMHLTPLGSLHTQSSYSRVSQSHQRRMKWGFPQSAATSKVPSVERRFLPRPCSNGGELGPVRKKTRQCSWISKARPPIPCQS